MAKVRAPEDWLVTDVRGLSSARPSPFWLYHFPTKSERVGHASAAEVDHLLILGVEYPRELCGVELVSSPDYSTVSLWLSMDYRGDDRWLLDEVPMPATPQEVVDMATMALKLSVS